jgi:ParB family transcriptional regulator, chromosome partitioning protein
MDINAANSQLLDVSVDAVERNKENPRIVFGQAEMDKLLESIRRYGIQVPISVYRKGKKYILIDGERRWRCAIKLNQKTMPALVQDEPAPLANLLLMFNIHGLREQWDLLTVSLKLPRVIELIEREGKTPTERELAERTGLPRSTIRRCRLLIDLPEQYKDQLLDELKKPKSEQKLSEDFFIEMEKSLTTVSRAVPELLPNKNKVRNVLISKYRNGTINNLVDLRKVGKIARAQNVNADPVAAKEALTHLFDRNDYSVQQAYQDSVAAAYSERDVLTRARSLTEMLDTLGPDDIDDETAAALGTLCERATALLQSR